MKQKKKKNRKLKYILIISVLIYIFTIAKMKTESDTISSNVSLDTQIIPKKENLITEKSSFPSSVYGVPVYTELIDINEETRPGIKRKIKYIVIHETDNFENRSRSKKSCQISKKQY